MKKNYEGSCHCGSIQFETSLDLDEAIQCDCSICIRKGSIVVRVKPSDFSLLSPLEELSLYSFNKHVAKHYFCRTCGIHPFHRPRSYPDLWAVNIRCLAGVDLNEIEPRPVFGSELD